MRYNMIENKFCSGQAEPLQRRQVGILKRLPQRAPAGMRHACIARCVRKKHSAIKCGAAEASRCGDTNGLPAGSAGSDSRAASVCSSKAPGTLLQGATASSSSRLTATLFSRAA